MDLITELEQKRKQLDHAILDLRKNGTARAEAEKEYKILLRMECLKLRDEGMAIGMIDKTCYGIPSVAEARYKRDIAETIYNKLDAGCGTNGNTDVSFTSPDGVVNNYKIVRPSPTPVYISVTINKTAQTPSTVTQDIKNAIINDANGSDANSGNTRIGVGQTIYASRFTVAIVRTAGVNDLESVYIGLSASPTGTSITLDADEEPVISAENIEVTINEP